MDGTRSLCPRSPSRRSRTQHAACSIPRRRRRSPGLPLLSSDAQLHGVEVQPLVQGCLDCAGFTGCACGARVVGDLDLEARDHQGMGVGGILGQGGARRAGARSRADGHVVASAPAACWPPQPRRTLTGQCVADHRTLPRCAGAPPPTLDRRGCAWSPATGSQVVAVVECSGGGGGTGGGGGVAAMAAGHGTNLGVAAPCIPHFQVQCHGAWSVVGAGAQV